MTRSTLVRGAMTAVGWLMRSEQEFFAPAQLADAVAHAAGRDVDKIAIMAAVPQMVVRVRDPKGVLRGNG